MRSYKRPHAVLVINTAHEAALYDKAVEVSLDLIEILIDSLTPGCEEHGVALGARAMLKDLRLQIGPVGPDAVTKRVEAG